MSRSQRPAGCPDAAFLHAMACGRLEPESAEALLTHLDTCAACRLSVATFARSDVEAVTHDVDDTAIRLAGRFTLGERLGAGGMGVVYAALDEELGVPIAVKLLRPDLDRGVSDFEGLRREVLLARRVRHPHVCAVHDLVTDGEQAFITMERIDGVPLDTACQRTPHLLPRWLDQILSALAAAHAQGIAHGDLKPSNILITAEEDVRVLDFGLAVDLSNAGTILDVVGGTPGYWSPEQARGERAMPQSDVFAVGHIAQRLASEPLRARLTAWIDICCALDPMDRFADADAAQRALTEMLTARPRTRLLWGAALIIGIGLGLVIWMASPSTTPRAPTPAAISSTGTEAYQAGVLALRQYRMNQATRSFERAARLAPDSAKVHLQLARALLWQGRHADARRATDQALAHADQLDGLDRLRLLAIDARSRGEAERARAHLERIIEQTPGDVEALFDLADLDFHSGNMTAASEGLQRTVELDPTHHRAWEHLAWALVDTGRPRAARQSTHAWTASAGNRRAWHERIEISLATGAFQALQADLEIARARWPDDSMIALLAVLGAVYSGRPGAIATQLDTWALAADYDEMRWWNAAMLHVLREQLPTASTLYGARMAPKPDRSAQVRLRAARRRAELRWLWAVGRGAPYPRHTDWSMLDPAHRRDAFVLTYAALACVAEDVEACAIEPAEMAMVPGVDALWSVARLARSNRFAAAADSLIAALPQIQVNRRSPWRLHAAEYAIRADDPVLALGLLDAIAHDRLATPQHLGVLPRALRRLAEVQSALGMTQAAAATRARLRALRSAPTD